MKNNNFSNGTEFLNEMGLTHDEFKLVCDALNGNAPAPGCLLVPWLSGAIGDACQYRHLDEKWGVDCKSLSEKIQALDENKVKDLLKKVNDFWN